MNFRTTLILLVVLAAAAVFLYEANRNSSDNDQTTQTGFDVKGKKLFDQKADDITKLTIQPADASAKPVVLAKDNGNWKLVQPVAWPAESWEARSLIESIVDLRSQGGVNLDSSNLSSTGLDHPRYTIEAADSAGKTLKLEVGNRSVIGNDLYVKVGDDKSGQMVSGGTLADKLDKGTGKLSDSLREKQLVKATSTTIKQFTVDHRGNKLALRKDGEDWKIAEPQQAPADSTAASDLISTVTDLRAEQFIDPSSPEASDAGFDHAKATVWFSTETPATQPTTAPATQPAGVTVTFGQFANVDRDKIYVKLSDPPVVARVAITQATLDKLTGANVLGLRDKKVVDIDPAHVTGFTLAVNRQATTQPTTQPAETYEFTISRRKESSVFGPMLPPSLAAATQPAIASTEPATQAPTTQPMEVASTAPSTEPSTQPTEIAATQPVTQPAPQPVVASTQPASKWVFESGATGGANDTEVDALLTALHPLTVVKYLETTPTTQPVANYQLTVHVGPSGGKGPRDVTLAITSLGATGNVNGSAEGLAFEVDRAIADKLNAKFGATDKELSD